MSFVCLCLGFLFGFSFLLLMVISEISNISFRRLTVYALHEIKDAFGLIGLICTILFVNCVHGE